MDTPVFYVALFVHLVSFITGFGSVIVIDTFGLLWLLKKVDLGLVNKVADVTQRLIWLGWSGLVASGIILITSKGYIDNLTQLKLFAVVMIGLNGVFLHYIKKSMEALGNQVTPLIQFRIGLASTISQVGWWSALTIGFLHRHWEHNIPWPSQPWIIMIFVAVLFVGTGLIGNHILKNAVNK